jgi:hypothetical protein
VDWHRFDANMDPDLDISMEIRIWISIKIMPTHNTVYRAGEASGAHQLRQTSAGVLRQTSAGGAHLLR